MTLEAKFIEEQQFRASFGVLTKGEKGDNGLSAYEIAVKNGFKGTETEWLESLKNNNIASWADIKRIVRLGLAKNNFPVGTQFLVKNSLVGDFLYDVVAHDHFKSAGDENAHTMTLLCHDIVPIDVPYDIPEAFYWHDPDLHDTDIDGDCVFYLPKAYKAFKAGYYLISGVTLGCGGKLILKDENMDMPNYMKSLSSHLVYISDENGTADGELRSIDGPYADKSELVYHHDLGTVGSKTADDRCVNDISRAVNGSNNYNKSAVRQVVFKSGTNGAGIFNTTYDGECNFVDSFDPEFLAVVGKVIVPCENCEAYEPYDVIPGASFYRQETFFLPSIAEITGVANGTNDLSTQLEYFKDASSVDRVKYLNGVARSYFTRSPYQNTTSTAHTVRVIYKTGEVSNITASAINGFVPMVNIVG